MPDSFAEGMGVLAGLVCLAAFPIYIRAILKGETKPNRASFLIWTLTGLLLLESYHAAGAHETLWVAGVYFIGPLIIWLLSLKYGVGGWSPLDRVCLMLALISVVLRLSVAPPEAALGFNIFMDIVAFVPTLKKSWLHPEQEDLSAWGFAAGGSFLNLFALTSFEPAVVAYPLYCFIIGISIVAVLIWRGGKTAIPQFPTWKKLEWSDRAAVERFTRGWQPYSDFSFISLWIWNIEEDDQIAQLDGHLLFHGRDYCTGRPLYSFGGGATAKKLLRWVEAQGKEPVLRRVPEPAVRGIKTLRLEEDREAFDYVHSLRELVLLRGNRFRSRKNFLNRFLKAQADARVSLLPFNPRHCTTLSAAVTDWMAEHPSSFINPHEATALQRLLALPANKKLILQVVHIGERLIALAVSEVLAQGYSMCHFLKADRAITGASEFLMREMACELLGRGCEYLNFQEDLGLPGLRAFKLSYRPKLFLKKYRVSFPEAEAQSESPLPQTEA